MALPGPVFAIGIITGIIAVVSWVAEAAAAIAAAVAAALTAMWAVLSPIFLALWHVISPIWSDVLKPAWDFVKKWANALYQVYLDHVKPIVDYLNGLTKVLRKIYATFIQPIRDLISILQTLVNITGLANTAFGRWLDGELSRIDGAISAAWQDLVGPINLLLHLVNGVILDARGLLQAPLLLESTAEYMGYITQQWWDSSLQTIKTNWPAILNDFHTGPRFAPSVDDGRQLIQTGGGGLQTANEHGLTIFRLLVVEDYPTLDFALTGTGPTEGPIPPGS